MGEKLDTMMINHALNINLSEEDLSYLYAEDEQKYNMEGGKLEEKVDHTDDKPNGGFPPIYVIDPEEKKKEESKNRQLTAKKVGVSIKDILESKKGKNEGI